MNDFKDAIENAKAQTALEAAINSLMQEVKRLTVTVEKNNEKLERLSALETSHNNTSDALERAFGSIAELRKEVEAAVERNSAEHRGYDKYIWMCVGFAFAISIVWSVLGYRMNSMVDNTVRAVAKMEEHIAQDRVMSESDVRVVVDKKP